MAETNDRSLAGKRPWTAPNLFYDGELRELVMGGGGKLSAVTGDPGEGRKPAGSET